MSLSKLCKLKWTRNIKKKTVAQTIPDVIRPEKKKSSIHLGYNKNYYIKP